MNVENSTALLLGGSGLVGMAVARELAPHRPSSIVVSGLTRAEVESAVSELRAEPIFDGIGLEAAWGDLFVAEAFKDRTRSELMADPEARAQLLDDIYGELTEAVLQRSTLGVLLSRWRPAIVVDCVNTATAFAYQNVFDSAAHLRELAAAGQADLDEVEGRDLGHGRHGSQHTLHPFGGTAQPHASGQVGRSGRTLAAAVPHGADARGAGCEGDQAHGCH